jgi:CheY-like chemotaxis protein
MEKEKILIIDDDPDIVESMKVILENDGYRVDSALNSEEGLEKFIVFRPALVILDVMMESMDSGFSLARQLKKDPKFEKIPILMLTAAEEKTGLNFKAEAGDKDWLPVEGFLDKPVASDVLLQTVAKLLEKS